MSDQSDTADVVCKVFAFPLGVLRSGFDAWVLLCLWRWFIVPLGVRDINFWHAYGLDVIIGLITLPIVMSRRKTAQEFTGVEMIGGVFGRFIGYAFLLGVGYAAHLFGG